MYVSLAVAPDWVLASLLCGLLKAHPATLSQILLVIVLCSIELFGRKDLGHNFPVQGPLVVFE